ncbi:MAG: hypothetical protein AAF676_06860 [Pseudomonadota bacterium]
MQACMSVGAARNSQPSPPLAIARMVQGGEPDLVHRRRREISARPVQCDRMIVPAVPRARPAWHRGEAAQTDLAHQPRDPLAADMPVVGAKTRMHARRCIGPAALCANRSDLGRRRTLRDGATALRPTTPSVVVARRRSENTAYHSNRPQMAVLIR